MNFRAEYGVYKASKGTQVLFTVMQHIDDASGWWRVMIGDDRRGVVVFRAKTLKACKAWLSEQEEAA